MSDELHDISVRNEETGAEVKSHITETGLVFSTISDDAPSFDDFFTDLKPLIGKVDFTKLPHRRSIKYEGKFNWKTMVDGYQECLHCQYTHPTFSIYYPPTFYTVYNYKNFSQHVADPKKPDDGLFLYFFPNCTLNVYGGGMTSFRVCPTADPGVTRMEFDYYHKETGEKFEEYFKFVRQVAMEDYELCEKAQENLEKGVYSEGILNPVKETGVAFYQQRVLDMALAQHERETQPNPAELHESTTTRKLPTSWFCITHSSAFTKPGDYISLSLAGFPLLVIYGKDKIVRAFHNVCRHRAYTITKKAAGSSLVLGCRYHGWSYDTQGRLVKAPQFDGVEGFDKAENGLWEVKSCVDRAGFVHINLDAGLVEGLPEYEGADGFAPEYGIDPGSKWLAGWEINGGGAFNWKTVGASDRTGIGTHTTPPQSTLMQRISSLFRRGPALDMAKSQAFHVGSTAVVLAFKGSPLWAMLTILPASATSCKLKCNVYTSDATTITTTSSLTDADRTALETYCNDFMQLMEEQQNSLVESASDGGDDAHDEPKPKTSEVEKKLKEKLKNHMKRERLAGRQIHPAAKQQGGGSESGCRAEQCKYFCGCRIDGESERIEE
ncbi:hypothetical protein N0V83_008587 [Neocucurbitaria cava]|uniref:Choline monooxygenase, chloroplastic n=1 Tax=Neocucurbitaria cava TaxID=798079 RepID=A0A9W8Y1Q3_9PLEO|nr:hypothetical protein N0V83_008587 [Neocucurbitaria cava]